MQDNYPNARFRPSQRARDALAEQNLTVNDAIDVAQGPGARWPGLKPNQCWHRSTTRTGKEIVVLVEDSGVGLVTIVTVRDVEGGTYR